VILFTATGYTAPAAITSRQTRGRYPFRCNWLFASVRDRGRRNRFDL